jgi:hypothetical protein
MSAEYNITESDKSKLRRLCNIQEKYMERLPKMIRDTDFSTAIGVALECNMDILREVACKLGRGQTPDAAYIGEKMACVEKWLKEAKIL